MRSTQGQSASGGLTGESAFGTRLGCPSSREVSLHGAELQHKHGVVSRSVYQRECQSNVADQLGPLKGWLRVQGATGMAAHR